MGEFQLFVFKKVQVVGNFIGFIDQIGFDQDVCIFISYCVFWKLIVKSFCDNEVFKNCQFFKRLWNLKGVVQFIEIVFYGWDLGDILFEEFDLVGIDGDVFGDQIEQGGFVGIVWFDYVKCFVFGEFEGDVL